MVLLLANEYLANISQKMTCTICERFNRYFYAYFIIIKNTKSYYVTLKECLNSKCYWIYAITY